LWLSLILINETLSLQQPLLFFLLPQHPFSLNDTKETFFSLPPQ